MDMALAIVVVVFVLAGIVYIIRPGKKEVDPVEPVTTAPPAAAADLPSQSSLMRLKKEDLEALALDRGVQHTGTKAQIVERLQDFR